MVVQKNSHMKQIWGLGPLAARQAPLIRTRFTPSRLVGLLIHDLYFDFSAYLV